MPECQQCAKFRNAHLADPLAGRSVLSSKIFELRTKWNERAIGNSNGLKPWLGNEPAPCGSNDGIKFTSLEGRNKQCRSRA